MKDRLIELLSKKTCRNNHCKPHCAECENVPLTNEDVERMADNLLENGVIVPPVKVGQILHVIEAGLINEAKVKEYKYCSNSNNGVHWHIIFEELFAMSEAHIGKDVFYTREEAQAKLKEGGEG